MNLETILNTKRGAIVAPAGCGKTHIITETLSVNNTKPILVLTHTTAGVSALKKDCESYQCQRRTMLLLPLMDGHFVLPIVSQ